MMVRKKLAVVVAALGALQTDVASALGLGELTLNSALNQPLEAEIRLLDTGDLDASQVLIKLGEKEDFDRAGVSRDFFLSNLKFKVDVGADGVGVIKINTKDSVVEPYLDFIIEARWPSGRILREYTVLFDLPTFSAAPAPAVKSSSSSMGEQTATTSQPAPQPTPVAATGSSNRESLRQGSLEAGSSYRVRRDDTLWEIAAKARPNSDTSVQQTMLGIQRNNPEAFLNGNINRLKAGYVLRLPTDSDIADLSENVAKKEVANQNRAWKTGETSPSLLTAAPLDASAPAASTDDSGDSDSRLSIAGSGSSSSDGSDGVESQGKGSAALSNELAEAEEQLDQTTRHNEEMAGRLSDMEAKMATLQRLLELKEDQLAAMQSSKASQPADSKPVVAETTPKVAPVPAPVPVAEPSFVEQLLENPLYLGAGAGLIGLAVIAVMLRRRRQSAEEYESVESLLDSDDADEELADLSLGDEDLEDSLEGMDEVAEEELDLEEASVGDFAAEDAGEIAEPEAATPVQSPVQSETGDAIAEADIYIAYGRFQQAMDLLKSAHVQEPQRSDLLVKLLEVCIEARDKPAFQEFYVKLQSLGDEGAVIQVKEMLSTVDGVADWLEGLPGTMPNFSDADMDAELIEGDTEESDADIEAALSLDNDTLELDAIDLGLDEDLDLDLDLDLEGDELDALSEGQTMQFDTAALDSGLAELSESSDSLELEDAALDIDEALSLDDLDAGDLELAVELEDGLELEDGALDAALEESVSLASLTDDDDLDLGADLELAVDLDSGVEDVQLELEDDLELEGELELDSGLDIDGDMDLDAELGDMDLGGELGDLEAEFESDLSLEPGLEGVATGETEISLSEELGSDDLSGMGGLDLASSASDIDLDELAADLSMDTGLDTELEDELDLLDIEAESAEDLDLTDTSESFDEAVADEEEDSEEFDFLADTDEVATKLDLARAYIDMGDTDGAKDILDEVVQEGNDEQKQEANALMERVE